MTETEKERKTRDETRTKVKNNNNKCLLIIPMFSKRSSIARLFRVFAPDVKHEHACNKN